MTLCDRMDCGPPGSSVHVIFQTGILEQVAFPSPGGLPDPGILRLLRWQADSLPSCHLGSPSFFPYSKL